jgi:hypothetical protein
MLKYDLSGHTQSAIIDMEDVKLQGNKIILISLL